MSPSRRAPAMSMCTLSMPSPASAESTCSTVEIDTPSFFSVDDNRVSRSHARIDWHGGTFQLIDLSYNGTYVRFDHDPEVISLRRGNCTLHGSGVIGLGAPPSEPIAPCVRFEVMKFADTQRQTPFEFGIKS